jgi:hypothetical protein
MVGRGRQPDTLRKEFRKHFARYYTHSRKSRRCVEHTGLRDAVSRAIKTSTKGSIQGFMFSRLRFLRTVVSDLRD